MTYKKISHDNAETAKLARRCIEGNCIDPEMYTKYDVKRGLREINGTGVLAGVTNISDIITKKEVNGEMIPCRGELYYRGVKIDDLIEGFVSDGRFGFEESCYLLFFGSLPNRTQLDEFSTLIGRYRCLPEKLVRDVVMKAPPADIMNGLARSVLTLHSYDLYANDISVENVLRQCLQLTAVFPLLAVYSYQAFNHYHNHRSLFIHHPERSQSTAETILSLLRPDRSFTALEARVLDMALVLHAEHGGGNNSTFTTHVVTSSGTDTYSAITAALCSLKGPRHGGANLKVRAMFDDIKKNIPDWEDEAALNRYLSDVLDKKAFDGAGLIYGMGHAVYSLSDPRAEILRRYAELLADEKGMNREFELYRRVDRLSTELIAEKKKIYKGVSANVDFYSGFVYSMLGIPTEIFTPIFAIARIAGWSAHRLEELISAGKIIRPAYKSVAPHIPYVPLAER